MLGAIYEALNTILPETNCKNSMFDPKVFLHNLTTRPGVYQMIGPEGKILYIGKARNLKKRIASYFTKKQDNKTFALINHIEDISVIVTHNEIEALLLESNLIKQFQPHYNILFRDDKSYPYIIITEEVPYPCIDFYRGAKKKGQRYFGPYPNAAAVRETIYLIQKLFGLRTCHDRYTPTRVRPCLQFQIGLCSGACAGLISREEYLQDIQHAILFLQGKKEEVLHDLDKKMDSSSKSLQYEKAAKFRDQIAKIRGIQSPQYVATKEGDVDVIGFAFAGVACIQLFLIRGGRILGSRSYFPVLPHSATEEEVIASFLSQHYLLKNKDLSDFPKEILIPTALSEQKWLVEALSVQAKRKITLARPRQGERKKWLSMANASAEQALSNHLLLKTHIQERIKALSLALPFNKSYQRIECFDISHTMGEASVASCVVFTQEGPKKSDYRQYNIKDITPGDDVAAMRQALLRRYQSIRSNASNLPDLIMIDGGMQQLNTAHKTLIELNLEDVDLMSIAKGEGRKPGLETLYFPHHSPLHLAPSSLALHFIQQIRDEAHRFAITGHRRQRDKKRTVSSLESIPGVGAKRRRELLRYFGGIQAINRASLEELSKVPGINRSLAERIFSALHDAVV